MPVRQAGGVRDRSHRVTLAACLLAWCLLALGVPMADALVSVAGTGQRNTLTAGTLTTPSPSTPIHLTVTGQQAGNVRLTWTATLTRAVTFVVQRATTAAPTTWTAVNGAGTASGSICTGTVPGTVSCTYTDTATYNLQYLYRVVSTIGGWTATTSAHLALSLRATAGSIVSPADLNAISAASPTRAWAVGNNCTIAVWDGATWIRQAVSEAICPKGTALTSVYAGPDFPVVGGNHGVGFGCTSGCPTATPVWYAGAPGPLNINAVYARTSKTIYGAGELCKVLYYDDTTRALVDVSPTAADCGNRTVRGIYGLGASGLVVVGDGGLILVCTANCTTTARVWAAPASVTPPLVAGAPTIWSVWAAPDGSAVIAVGDGGTVVGCTSACATASGSWARVSGGTTSRLRSVAATGADLAYAVGDDGAAVRCTSACATSSGGWSAVTSGTSADLRSVALLGGALVGGSVLAVGAGGVARTSSDGTTWTAVSPPVPTGPTETALEQAELDATATDLGGSRLGARLTWPRTAVASSCPAAATDLTAVRLQPAATIPAGAWTVGSVKATVRMTGTTTPGTGAALRLLVSPDAGTSWQAYPLGLPPSYGADSLTTVDLSGAVTTTAQVAAMRWCLVGSSGAGRPLTTQIDLVHVDVN